MEDFSQYDLYPNGFSRMIVPIGFRFAHVQVRRTEYVRAHPFDPER